MHLFQLYIVHARDQHKIMCTTHKHDVRHDAPTILVYIQFYIATCNIKFVLYVIAPAFGTDQPPYLEFTFRY